MENQAAAQLKKDERIDDLQRDGLKIIQNPRWFSFGIDAVLLAHFSAVGKGQTVMDLGTGTGIVPLLLSAKTRAAHITGIELQEDVSHMAKRSVALNGLEDRIAIETMDIKDIATHFKKSCMDVVTANPPYFKAKAGIQNDTDYKTLSRHEVACTLEDLFRAAYHVLKPSGVFYMVHRPDRLVDIVAVAREMRLEPKQIRFVQPKADAKPNIMLMRFVKYGGHELRFDAPLVVYNESGDYTPEIYKIYEEATIDVFEASGTPGE